MIIGVDFDNTIVCYDALFHRVAAERGLIPEDLPVNKTAVRDHLRATRREDIWTEMQGEVYGARMPEAEPYPGAIAFFRACREQGIPVRIISHKTRHPYRGERHDLHAAARNWLRLQGFFDTSQIGLRDDDVFFELTKIGKLQRIAACGCTHFIDDLPELLVAAEFPAAVARYLFDPEKVHGATTGVQSVSSWGQFQTLLLDTDAWVRAALALADRAGHLSRDSVRPLHGGSNNRVVRLGDTAVAKRYFQHPGDPRDRFATERAFYNYASAVGVTCIPRPLGWDEVIRFGVFDYVRGQRPVRAEAPHVEAALQFFAQLNQQRNHATAAALPLAAEACLSLEAHLETVRSRVDSVASLPCEDALDEEASEFVHAGLQPLWENIRHALIAAHDPTARTRELPPAERCISPSDFGFHNALEPETGAVVFFDFEYAGWDDPAKLVADFFCQPDVPVPSEFFAHFVSAIGTTLGLVQPENFASRCHALLPVYQVKWSCILLNDFTRVGRDRRVFSLGPAEAATRRQRQLDRVRKILSPLLLTA